MLSPNVFVDEIIFRIWEYPMFELPARDEIVETVQASDTTNKLNSFSSFHQNKHSAKGFVRTFCVKIGLVVNPSAGEGVE